jgi:hypothetical protein
MIKPTSLKSHAYKVARTLTLMVVGAWMLALYLDFTSPASEEYFSDLRDGLGWAFLALLLIEALLRPEGSRPFYLDIAPRWSGVSVVLITGAAAAYFVATGSFQGGGYLPAAIIILLTIAVAAGVWHFATRHAADIGEARFTSKAADSAPR